MTAPTRRRMLVALGAVPLVFAGCGGGGGGGDGGGNVSFNAAPVVDHVTDDIIVPTYVALNAAAAVLLAAVQALQAAPTEPLMNAAQDAWKAARVPWETSEGFLYGPVDSLGIDPSIDSWPLNTPDLQAFLTSNPNATQADIENASDDLRGFHAIEFLLFGDGTTVNDKAASDLNAAQANYLVALAQAFKARTHLLETSWTTASGSTPAYETTMTTPPNATYSSYGAVLEEIIGGLATIADEVGNAKMAEPLGTSAAAADTSKVESQYSWNSLTDFHNNIQSILNVYTGRLAFSWESDTPAVTDEGVYAFVAAHDATLATRVYSEIVDTQKKIALIKGDGDDTTTAITGTAKPFRQQISDPAGRTLIETAIAACNTLKTTLEGSVAPLVGQTSFT